MKDQNPPKVLLVTGMHRSGTSLCARWLHDMGLDLGNNLMIASDASNPDGYYEDYDFLHWHNRILKKNDTDYLADVNLPLQVDQSDVEEAVELIKRRHSTGRPWGWKDPRAILFLSFWSQQISSLHKLFLFRSPDATVDSLLRREFYDTSTLKVVSRWRTRWLPKISSRQSDYLRAWNKYNTLILQHYRPGRDILISVEKLLADSLEIANSLVDHFGFDLRPMDIQTLRRPEMPLGNKYFFQWGKHGVLEEEAKNLYSQLLEASADSLID